MKANKNILKIQIGLLTLNQVFVSVFWGIFTFIILQFFILDFLPKILISGIVVLLVFVLKKGFLNKKDLAFGLLHQKNASVQYSLPLLYKSHLNQVETIQLERINNQKIKIYWPFDFKILVPILLSFLVYFSGKYLLKTKSNAQNLTEKSKAVTRKNTIKTAIEVVNSSLSVVPPPYTGLPQVSTQNLNAEVYQASVLKWSLKFNYSDNIQLFLEGARGQKLSFKSQNLTFELSDKVLASGFYSITGYQSDSLVYKSPLYSIQIIPDKPPVIKPALKELYSFHQYKDAKILKVNAHFSDDFKVKQAYMVATVARGSGENVKFREVQWRLSNSEFSTATLSKEINLKELNFSPGDELYYYWAALDNKTPEANFTKSDTYFVVYKDTASNSETELATMAMNILPEYFRSQRQIIIDTEKLIKKRKKISEKQFKYDSNELGYEQKVLRLRYGQYLGEEFEGSIGHADPSQDNENWLEGFVHAHDAEEQEDNHESHEQHGHEHNEASGKTEETDPLAALMEQYVHSHDDGELNTFYEQSTRSLLKMALEQMWQSELHLRLYEPEKALPFENKALEYLKQAQQKARVFVKKSGFDPPPIKENEKRLTGETKKLYQNPNFMRKFMLGQLQELASELVGLIDKSKWNEAEKTKMAFLANELIRYQNGGMVRNLQTLINGTPLDPKNKSALKTELLKSMGVEAGNKNAGALDAQNLRLRDNFWKQIQ